ncbi:hypothetical protein FQZ97_958670 [compost metagenome]
MQVGEGQGQHHHDQATQRVEHLAPELDLITLGGLTVGLQVLDVGEEIRCAHALGFEQRR